MAETKIFSQAFFEPNTSNGCTIGRQRFLRRKRRLTFTAAAVATAAGGLWMKCVRHNTFATLSGATPLFALTGALVGHSLGSAMYNLNERPEGTRWRRLARQCSKRWVAVQAKAKKYVDEYPRVPVYMCVK